MMHGIIMDVVEVMPEIVTVANDVILETILPNAPGPIQISKTTRVCDFEVV